MSDGDRLLRRVEEERRRFDEAFASPPAAESGATRDLVLVRVAARKFALSVEHLKLLGRRRKIVELPSEQPHLLGLAGIRGALVPVFDLAGLLGLPAPERPPDWLAISGEQDPMAFAFDSYEGHVRVEASCLVPASGAEGIKRQVRLLLRLPDEELPVIHLPATRELVLGETKTVR